MQTNVHVESSLLKGERGEGEGRRGEGRKRGDGWEEGGVFFLKGDFTSDEVRTLGGEGGPQRVVQILT